MTATNLPVGIANKRNDPVDVEAEPYKERLNRDMEWAMDEGDKFFQEASAAHKALRKIAARLSELGIDYAVVGAMAMFRHGYRRFTEDVDLLVTRDGLEEIHRRLEGLGYRPPFQKSRHLRDTELGVKIEFLVTGDFPGDSKPKPVAFPDPAAVAESIRGIPCLRLSSLVELKLASGMTNVGRTKDLGDVTEMIKELKLARDFVRELNPFVQEKYRELWDGVNSPTARYVTFRRIEGVDSSTKSTGELVTQLSTNDDTVRAMLADGVTVDRAPPIAADEIRFVTGDPAVARKHDMHDETEFR
jgi:hypothetical protein